MRMDVVDPEYFLGLLDHRDVEIDDDGLLAAAHDDAFERLGLARIDLLVRHEGRHPDEIAGPRFRGELEPLAPTHARFAFHNVDHALDRAVVMRSGFGVRLDVHRPGPDLLGAHAREVD